LGRKGRKAGQEGRRRATLADVARAAGVSTATVSRCLNAPRLVLADTRARVLEAVEATGYTPDFGGRALASRRTNTFGAVIPTMENAIFARALQAFGETLGEAGATLLVASSGYDPAREDEQIRTLVTRGADGLLLIGTARAEAATRFLERTGVPCVIAWTVRRSGSSPRPFVGFDNTLAMAALTRRVLAYGHHHVAMIAGLTANNDRAAERVMGFRAALRDNGIDPASAVVLEAPYGIREGAEAFAALRSHEQRPTAVLCGNDVLAAGAVAEARRAGLSVPQDVSITGFDDIDIALVVEPRLTTVHVPHRRMGAAAARLLLALRDGAPWEDVRLETTFVRGASLGPPPDAARS